MDNRWSDRLRRRMEDHTETPPAGLWDAIEREMDRAARMAASAAVARSKRRRMLFWATGTVAAAAVVAAFVVFFGGVGLRNDLTPPPVPTISQEYRHRGATPASASATAPIPTPNAAIASAPTHKSSVFARRTPSFGEQVAVADLGTVPETVLETTRGTHTETAPKTTPETTPTTEAPRDIHTSDDNAPAADPVRTRPAFPTYDDDPVSRHRTKKSKWQASLFAANISSGVSAVDGNGNGNGNGPMALESAGYYTFDETSYAYNAKVTMPTYTDVRHRQPLTVGISVEYGFDERWSLASGVTYTLLSSTFRIESSRASQTHEQRLHNIGIPLNLNYNILRSSRFSLYLSAGGVVEKSVAGTLTRKIATNGSSDSPRKESVSDRIQWSVGAFVGGQWDFAKRTGIYVEPGVSYRFDNHSAVETIYKERPVNFDLRFGLRFSL